MRIRSLFPGLTLLAVLFFGASSSAAGDGLRIRWEKNYLTISGDDLPGGEMRVQYLEAYCRPGSTDRDWGQTVIGHTTELISRGRNGQSLRLRCVLADGIG